MEKKSMIYADEQLTDSKWSQLGKTYMVSTTS